MSNLTAIDADGHIIERESEIRKHLKAPWNLRTTSLRPGDQPWDNYMFGHFVTELTWSKLSAREQVTRWHDIMDEHQIETAVCFPPARAALSVSKSCHSRSPWRAPVTITSLPNTTRFPIASNASAFYRCARPRRPPRSWSAL